MIYLIRYWKPLALLALVLALFGAGFWVRSHEASLQDDIRVAREAANKAEAEVEALKRALALQEAATQAAQAARTRNDTKLPEVRSATAERVDRAPVADNDQRLSDVAAALDAYNAARNRLPRASASGAVSPD
jgi:hypothetical protein